MKIRGEGFLLLTSLVGFCIILPFVYLRDSRRDRTLRDSLDGLSRRIEERSKENLEAFADLPPVPEPRGHGPGEEVSELSGLCFFETHEVGRLLMARIQEGRGSLSVAPPLEPGCRLRGGAVEITWKANPANDELLRELKENPLLTFGYRIYRWSAGTAEKPEIIATLPRNRNRFVDKNIGPVGSRYFYSVLATLEGMVGEEKTLLASGRSEVVSIVCPDRFTLRLLGGDEDTVKVEVTVERNGLPLSQTFQVREGDAIGTSREIPGRGTVDFTTGLVLEKILVREEERAVNRRHPVFNADGSRSVDPATGEPLFREETVKEKYKKISIRCRDPGGRTRVVEQG